MLAADIAVKESEVSMTKEKLHTVANRVYRALKDCDEGFQKQWRQAIKDKSIDMMKTMGVKST